MQYARVHQAPVADPSATKGEAVLSYETERESFVSIEHFPPDLTPPSAITVITKTAEHFSAMRFDIGEQDDAGRWEYTGQPPKLHQWHPLTCAECRTHTERFYRRWGLWRCRACWIKAARAALPTLFRKD